MAGKSVAVKQEFSCQQCPDIQLASENYVSYRQSGMQVSCNPMAYDTFPKWPFIMNILAVLEFSTDIQQAAFQELINE